MRIILLLGLLHTSVGCVVHDAVTETQHAQAHEPQSAMLLKFVDWIGFRSSQLAEAKFRFTNLGDQAVYLLTHNGSPVTYWERWEGDHWTGHNAIESVDGQNMTLMWMGVEFGHEVGPGESLEFGKTVYKSLFTDVKQVRLCAYLCDNTSGDGANDERAVKGAGFTWDGD